MQSRLVLLSLVFALGACAKKAPPPPPPPQAGYVTVKEATVSLTTELPGRVAAFETSDVRPQVNGLILRRLFREGDEVRQGQALYQIDPAPYEAAVANARAALVRARAAINSSRNLAQRYGQLVAINAISKQDYENAQTSAGQAEADVAAQTAALRTATIDLERTKIKAPISGRIGRSTYTPGALVTTGQADALTTIQRIDTVYVDVNQASAAVLALRQKILAGNVARNGKSGARVQLKLEDGSTYPFAGTLQFADVTVDATTGSQTIRATFPNPQRLLLPGMYARAELVEGTQAQALLVPQRAVSRDEKGNPTVMVIGAGNKVELRQLTTSRTSGDDWIVSDGVKAGDKVIVEGGMMLRPGAPVTPAPYTGKPADAPAAGQPAAAK
ncbi:efflux RND transporter periplasmic adaptor subunit [Sphingomonas nostoxanthinifaciens]|uniref:efflux RND transporter periplasmic adaptor subunit n=1 Tax=Sphingomonas nostoxanthinifaciens TaxID=2872652 RepID=UPI001CC1CFEF|nr:efflux RND transporter periplasmic adaptor subunit [Sphingomonas nostoxanthinifaciens]UAK24028.1 efflux RND transporter periplasmic adaptor subunit [Sphingomonas nostoxanthinifaciens]